MIAKNANFFLKPNDIISHRLTLFGVHEPHIEKLIVEASAAHRGFFLDIGANIGMTSAFVGRQFARVDCVEPNELVMNILKTNLAMNFPATDLEIHAMGFEEEDAVLKLRVPADDFGGAYVETANPQFENETSSQHSNHFGDRAGHFALDVTIKEVGCWLRSQVRSAPRGRFAARVVKIDVEGYEEIIFDQDHFKFAE